MTPVALAVDAIVWSRKHRAPDEATIKRLMESISQIGLLQPIVVRIGKHGQTILVAGRHRLEAFRRLGLAAIPCHQIESGKFNSELAEIAENLDRHDLTALERAELTARWIVLSQAQAAEVSGQPEQKPKGGRPEGGISRLARQMNKTRSSVRRARAVAYLSPPAKAKAIELGLDRNSAAMMRAAKLPVDKQVDALIAQAEAKAVAKASRATKPPRVVVRFEPPLTAAEIAAHKPPPGSVAASYMLDIKLSNPSPNLNAAMAAWRALTEGERESFQHFLTRQSETRH